MNLNLSSEIMNFNLPPTSWISIFYLKSWLLLCYPRSWILIGHLNLWISYRQPRSRCLCRDPTLWTCICHLRLWILFRYLRREIWASRACEIANYNYTFYNYHINTDERQRITKNKVNSQFSLKLKICLPAISIYASSVAVSTHWQRTMTHSFQTNDCQNQRIPFQSLKTKDLRPMFGVHSRPYITSTTIHDTCTVHTKKQNETSMGRFP